MAGAGKRFIDAGYSSPKPLIRAKGEPMYRIATRSLPLDFAENLIFCIKKSDHDVLYDDIYKNFSNYNLKTLKNE